MCFGARPVRGSRATPPTRDTWAGRSRKARSDRGDPHPELPKEHLVPDLNPALQAGVPTHTERLAQVRELLAELSRREVLALAASTPPSNRFGWANLGPDSGLTEDQENILDNWGPAHRKGRLRA